MTRWLRRPGAALLIVLAVLAGGLGAATATTPDRQPVTLAGPIATRPVAVARAGAACPDPVVDEETTTEVAVAAPGPLVAPGVSDGPDPAEPPGRLGLELLAGGQVSGAQQQAPGAVTHDAMPDQGPLVARGVDGSAPGLAASQLTRSTAGTMRGLAGVSCSASSTDAWFVGSGAVVGERGRVYLTNVEAAPAVVDVLLYGPDGPIDAPDARGVSVAPGEQQVRLLDALAPGVERFAVHVHARQGRIAAAVRDLQVDGLTPLGADWVPVTSPPARRVVVAGLPGGAGERRLQIVAPGGSDAIVRVRLISGSGAFAPAGLDVVEVPAGSVTDVDVAPFAGGEPVSVELSADAPITAGVLTRLPGSPGELGEIAYASAAVPLVPDAPGVVAQVSRGERVRSTLLLTAPAGDATVQLTPLPPASGPGRRVTVPGASLLAVDLDVAGDGEGDVGSYALTVAPVRGSGPVLAVRLVEEAETRGPLLISSPVEPGHYAAQVPRVTADLSAGLRAGP